MARQRSASWCRSDDRAPQVARAARVPVFTVDRYARRGHLDAFTLAKANGPGSRRRFHPHAVRAVVAMAAFPPRHARGNSQDTRPIRQAIADTLARESWAGAVLVWRLPAWRGDEFAATAFTTPLAALHAAFRHEITGTVLCLDRLLELAEETAA